MRASDIYGSSVFATGRTEDDTLPTQSTVAAQGANDVAKKKGGTSYGMLAIIIMIGILIGAKFALEK